MNNNSLINTSLSNDRTHLACIRLSILIIGTSLLLKKKWILIVNCFILLFNTYKYYNYQSKIIKLLPSSSASNLNIIYNTNYYYVILTFTICLYILLS